MSHVDSSRAGLASANIQRGGFMGIEPGTNAVFGRTTCQGLGVATRLTATVASALSITIKALSGNNATVNVAFGTSVGVATFGFPLENTPESVSIDIDSPSKVWIRGTTTDAVAWFGLLR